MQEMVPELEDGETSFEAIYERLEQAVDRLESGGLGLEESIAVYETGMRLARRCKEMLDSAELRVSELEDELSPPEPEEAEDVECDDPED